MSMINRRALALAAAALGVAAAGATVMQYKGASVPQWMATTATAAKPHATLAGTAAASAASLATATQPQTTYIVVFKEAPLATYQGGVSGLPAPSLLTTGPRAGNLDVKSAAAQRYVSYLRTAQSAHVADLGRALGRPLHVSLSMQHALNAVVATLSPDEAKKLATQPDVQMVEAYKSVPIETDVGPHLIGADAVWNGTVPGVYGKFQGEGVVVGIIDTGINFESPSFSATSAVDGYTVRNPLGQGNYLGTCAPGGIDDGRCNDKLIGGYDFVCNLSTGSGSQTYCSQTANYREEPGFGDTNGHGSHTASTAAGNRRDVMYKGNNVRLSGVAPHANIIAYDVCYTDLATGGGFCPNVASAQAVDQAIADGVVSVLNFSVGGGTSPWNDVVSQAFLNATEAGIYVAAAAGNSGPAAGTTGHAEPWVSTTAAAQHGRGDFVFNMHVTAPTPVPTALQSIVLNQGSGGPAFTTSIPNSTPIKASPNYAAADDGCTPFAAGAFTGAIAVVKRGTCNFSVKVDNAAAAGAVAVIIGNNQAGVILPSVPGTTIPSFSVSTADGAALAAFAAANATATAGIPSAATIQTNQPDQLADFSSRGPAGTYNLMKPDVTAPGVRILATVSGTTVTGSPDAIDLYDGTSMASPHNAGSGALLHQAHPDWRPSEIKSALALTATDTVVMPDGVTPAGVFAAGSGRIQVDAAARAGLVMNETKANYLAANPATGGDLTKLNLPSLLSADCNADRCVFTRTFRNTVLGKQTWNISFQGLNGTASVSSFTMTPGQKKTITFTFPTNTLVANGQFNYGKVTLTPANANTPVLHLPVALAVKPGSMVATPSTVSASVAAGGTTSAALTLGNPGGVAVNFAYTGTGTAASSLVNQPVISTGSGYLSTFLSDQSPAFGYYEAEDFTVPVTTGITRLVANGFTISGGQPLATAAASIRWTIFPDASNSPAGNPETALAAASWTYVSGPNGLGVSTDGGTISLDLAAAGQTLNLPAGKYWFVVNPTTTTANRWYWYGSSAGNGNFRQAVPASSPTWASINTSPGLAWSATGNIACGAPWIVGSTPTSGVLDAHQSIASQIRIDASGLTAGTYSAFACFQSSSSTTPKVAVRVNLTVN